MLKVSTIGTSTFESVSSNRELAWFQMMEAEICRILGHTANLQPGMCRKSCIAAENMALFTVNA